MREGETARPRAGRCARACLLGGAGLYGGQILGGAILLGTGLVPPQIPGGVPPVWLSVLAAFLLAACVAPASLALGGSGRQRGLAIAGLIFLAGGLNTALETAFFTTLGGEAFVGLSWLVPAGLAGGLMAWRPRTDAVADVRSTAFSWRSRSLAGWTWRLIAAWAAFPVVYFVFGIMVVPIVLPHYGGPDGFLVVPPVGTILCLQAVRSLFFLAASLGIVALWTGTRAGLALKLGLAHFGLVGLYGLTVGTFLPPVLRWTHGVEILADSLAYAAILAWLLAPPRERRDASASPPQSRRAGPAPQAQVREL